MATNVDNGDTKLWPDTVTKVFIDIMVDEFTKGNMPNSVFHSGFGWDAETNTVTAAPEVWQNYLRVHDKVAQFQKKGCDHYKLLGIIFNKYNATGVLHHASTQDPLNTDEEKDLENQYLNTRSNVHVENDSSDDDIQEECMANNGKRKFHAKDHKYKKESTSRQMGEALVAWAEACTTKAEKYKARSVEATPSLVTPDCSITKCAIVLEELGGILDDIYMKAFQKFWEPSWREMFLAMSNNRRRAWLFRL